jgi:hypothetical protein
MASQPSRWMAHVRRCQAMSSSTWIERAVSGLWLRLGAPARALSLAVAASSSCGMSI